VDRQPVELDALVRGAAAAARRLSRGGVRRVPAPATGSCAPPGDGSAHGARPEGEADSSAHAGLTTAAIAQASPDLASLRRAVQACTACDLSKSRTRTVFADGPESARVMFVGEAPGFHEDQQGVPFVGQAGELLTDIIHKGMGLRRDEVVIANVLKCRPPENRDPTTSEKELCTAFLDRQIDLVDPEVIIALGRHAAQHLLGTHASMASMRGQVHHRGARRVVATYHPAYLLRSPEMKGACWQDIQLAMAEIGLKAPGH